MDMTLLLVLTAICSTITALGQIYLLTAPWRQKRWEAKQARKRAKRDAEWEAYIGRAKQDANDAHMGWHRP